MPTIYMQNQGPQRSVSTVFRCLFLAAAAIAAQAQTITHQITLPPTMYWCDDSLIHTLFSEINSLRAKNNLPALRSDKLGNKVAELRAVQFANYMATHAVSSPGFNPHEGYDTTAASVGYNLVSENLAYLSLYPSWIVRSIWQGRLHLAAMLNSQANVAGVSCLMFDGGPFWTYVPGIGSSSASPAPAPAPTPTPSPTPTPAPTPAPAPAPPTGGTTTTALDAEQAKFLTLINTYRAQNGASALQVSVALQNASQWMSVDMAKRGFGNHVDSLGRSPSTRMASFGYPYYPNGENIAGGLDDAQGTFDQWKNACDPDAAGRCTYAHRVNMLSPSYVVLGIGRAYGPGTAYGWYWTTDFGGYLDRTITQAGSTTPLPPAPSAPVISSFTASPSSIQAGQSSTLAWNISGATALSIDVLGNINGLTSKVVSPNQTTAYWLTATNAIGTTAARLTITVTGAPPSAPITDTQPPTVPNLTSATASGPNQVNLAWGASTDNVGVARYQVFRTGTLIANTSSATRSFSDLTASAGSTYTYWVRALDAASNASSPSNSIQATTPPAATYTPPAPSPPSPTAPAPASPSGTSCASPATNAFSGCYYNNITLSGSPSLVRIDNLINFNWGTDSPAPAVTPLNFSVRWQGYFTFQTGEYTFNTIASDGLRIYIDGQLILDRWRDQPGYMYNIRRTITQGSHLVTVEYYERTGLPIVSVSWQKN